MRKQSQSALEEIFTKNQKFILNITGDSIKFHVKTIENQIFGDFHENSVDYGKEIVKYVNFFKTLN